MLYWGLFVQYMSKSYLHLNENFKSLKVLELIELSQSYYRHLWLSNQKFIDVNEKG
jgi:hypothetical protein